MVVFSYDMDNKVIYISHQVMITVVPYFNIVCYLYPVMSYLLYHF
jgi:hypothetical protein